MRVQAELDETKIVLHKTIDSVLERGVRLEDLIRRSDVLNGQAKQFLKAAKKQVCPPCQNSILTTEFVLYCHVGECMGYVY
jgi:hypothetical protein